MKAEIKGNMLYIEVEIKTENFYYELGVHGANGKLLGYGFFALNNLERLQNLGNIERLNLVVNNSIH